MMDYSGFFFFHCDLLVDWVADFKEGVWTASEFSEEQYEPWRR